MLGEEDDLADVLGVVGESAIERLHNRVRLLTDGDGALNVFRFQ